MGNNARCFCDVRLDGTITPQGGCDKNPQHANRVDEIIILTKHLFDLTLPFQQLPVAMAISRLKIPTNIIAANDQQNDLRAFDALPVAKTWQYTGSAISYTSSQNYVSSSNAVNEWNRKNDNLHETIATQPNIVLQFCTDSPSDSCVSCSRDYATMSDEFQTTRLTERCLLSLDHLKNWPIHCR